MTKNLRVYFDGLCPLCSREIDFYRRKEGSEKVDWIDITSKDFDAGKEGLDAEKAHVVFHVKKASGEIVAGVEGFIEIWRVIPSLNLWARATRLPGAVPLMKMGYALFVRVRPYLPRLKRDDCDTGLCEASLREASLREVRKTSRKKRSSLP